MKLFLIPFRISSFRLTYTLFLCVCLLGCVPIDSLVTLKVGDEKIKGYKECFVVKHIEGTEASTKTPISEGDTKFNIVISGSGIGNRYRFELLCDGAIVSVKTVLDTEIESSESGTLF